MATSEGIPSSIDIEFLELNDNPYLRTFEARWQRGKASTGSQGGAKRGRSNMHFESVLIGDEAKKKQTLKRLHGVIDGKKGVYVATVIKVAVGEGLITQVSDLDFEVEFIV